MYDGRSDEELDGNRRQSRTLFLGGAYPRRQGLGEAPDGLAEGAQGLKDRLRLRRLSIDGADTRRFPKRGLKSPPTIVGANSEASSSRSLPSAGSPKEGLTDRIRRTQGLRLSVDCALRVGASSSPIPERLKIEEFSHVEAMTITRDTRFVSSAKKHLPPSPGAGSPPTKPEFNFRRTPADPAGHPAARLMRRSTQLQAQSELAWVRDSLSATSDHGAMLGHCSLSSCAFV